MIVSNTTPHQQLALVWRSRQSYVLWMTKMVYNIAQLNNLPVTGTLVILLKALKARKTGLISSVKELIDRLRSEHHFWIKEDMYQKLLRIAKKKVWN